MQTVWMERIFGGLSGKTRRVTAGKNKVVVLSELFRPEMTSTGYYLTKIAERLALEHDVEVFCGQPTYAERGRRAPSTEQDGRLRINRVRSSTFDKDRIGLRLLNLVTLTWSIVARSALAIRPGDVVIVVTNPPTLPLIMALICRMRRAKLVALIHDRFPEVMVAVGFRSKNDASVRVLEELNKWLLPKSACIVVVGRDMGEQLEKQYPLANIAVLGNWAENATVRPVPLPERSLRSELGLPSDRVVLYAGNFGRANDLETLLGAAELLRKSGIFFALIGHGVNRPSVEATIRSKGLDHVRVAGPYPREAQCQLLACGDIVVIPSIPGMCGISVPSRIYNSLAAGRPVVVATEATAEIARIVTDFNVGWIVPPASAELLAEAIREALIDTNQSELDGMGRRAIEAAQNELSESRMLDQWSQLVRQLLAETQGF